MDKLKSNLNTSVTGRPVTKPTGAISGTSNSKTSAVARGSAVKSMAASSGIPAGATGSSSSREAPTTSAAARRAARPLVTGKPVTTGQSPSKKGKRSMCPSRKRRSDLRLATRLVGQLSAKPADTLSSAQASSLEWAKGVCEGTKPLTEKAPLAAEKRQRSVEENKPGNSSKRPKNQGRSFSDVAKDSLVVGVLDEGTQDGRIPKDRWRLVEGALLSVFMDIVSENPGPVPICEDAGWFQGNIKLIGCSDERAVRLYKAAISRVGEVWPGARLKAVDRQDIPSRPRARAWVPLNAPTDSQEILRIINHCNPSLPTKDWRVVKIEEPVGNSRQVVLVLNQESLKLLEEAGGQIRFGFTSISLKVYKVDALNVVQPVVVSGKPDVKSGEQPSSEDVEDLLLEDDRRSVTAVLSESFSRLLDEPTEEVIVNENSADKPPSQ